MMDRQFLVVPDLLSTRACFHGDKDDVSQQCEQQHWLGIFSICVEAEPTGWNTSAPAEVRSQANLQYWASLALWS